MHQEGGIHQSDRDRDRELILYTSVGPFKAGDDLVRKWIEDFIEFPDRVLPLG